MGDIVEISVRPGEGSLAHWVLALRPGSPCFCCGHPFHGPVGVDADDQDASSRLECFFCGAEVITHEASDAVDVPFSPRHPVLVAA